MANRVLFTNVKYWVGGGKSGKPLRIRKHQNIHLTIHMPVDGIKPYYLDILSDGKYMSTKLTKIKIRNHEQLQE
jgi:hypothetical protein